MGICASKTNTSTVNPSDLSITNFSQDEEIVDGYKLSQSFLNKYELLLSDDGSPDIIGHGSFSKVFKCRNRITSESFALKYVDMEQIASRGAEAVERTKKEVRRGVSVLITLHHESIINLEDYYESPNTMCVVLELAGMELYDHVVEQGKLTEGECATILRSIAEGVCFMHEKNLVHRDLKPENVVLGVNNTWKIIDFGFSRVIESKLSRMKSFVGTMNYVAPEVVERKEYKSSVDVWSIGVISFVLLVGYLPFNTSSPEEREKHEYQVSFRSKHWDKISFAAKTFVARCLSKDPEDRPTTNELLEMSFLNLKMHRQRRESKLPLASPTRLKNMVEGVVKIEDDDDDEDGNGTVSPR